MDTSNLHDESELLQRMAQGDELAYKRLFERYFSPLFATVIQYTHKKDDAGKNERLTFVNFLMAFLR